MKNFKNEARPSSRKLLALALGLMPLILTGCPHDDYLVQLKPEGDHVVRTLTVYTADGADTNGTPNYKAVDSNQLAALSAIYTAAGPTTGIGPRVFRRVFTNTLPDDVGGAGIYTNLTTTLGDAGFYAEHFRGSDDMAGMLERRLQAANDLTDQMLGWSLMALGKERGYDHLHQFLDVEFRRDLKNLGLYWWEGTLAARSSTNASEEFCVRYGQYLLERGYVTTGELPGLVSAVMNTDSGPIWHHIQRLVARQMGVPDSQAVPPSLAFLADENVAEKSFMDYLATTPAYHASLQKWAKERQLQPNLKQPQLQELEGHNVQDLLDFDPVDEPDHLAVHLSLPVPPIHTNGRYDPAHQEVIWDTTLRGTAATNVLPATCYANWVMPRDDFQQQHFGKVAVTGDDLAQYCLWRASVNPQQGEAWDSLLASLRPGSELAGHLKKLGLTQEAQTAGAPAGAPISKPYAVVCDLLINDLK